MFKKKILAAGFTDSIHFKRWVEFLQNSGFEVHILSFVKNKNIKYNKKNYFDFSVRIKNKFVKVLFLFLKIISAIKFIKISDYSFINFHYMETHLLLIALLCGKKYILTSWGSDILIDYKKTWGIKKIIFDWTFKKAFCITCDSISVKKTIIDRCRNIDENKIKIIYWGVDENIFFPLPDNKKARLRIKYGIPENSIVLLSMRSIFKLYRIKEIIMWFNKKIRNKNIILLIKITPNKDERYLEECIEAAKENKKIIFNRRKINHEKLNEIYNISDITLNFPLSDSIPSTILESIASGNMIVCSSSIKAYRELKKYYKIEINDLKSLDENDIIKQIKKKKQIIKHNTEIFKKIHEEKITIESIKKYFNISDHFNGKHSKKA